MGSGKTSLGKRVAKILHRSFIDTDQLIVRVAGADIPTIFEAHGEEGFRNYESAAIRSLSIQSDAVIATGGGAILRPENREVLRSLGLVVWLDADEEILFERVRRNRRRPLLRTSNPRETIQRLLNERRPLYAEAAHVHINTSGLEHEEAAKRVISALEAHWPCLKNRSKND